MIKKLDFFPPFGLSSPHLQTILAPFGNHGSPPSSEEVMIPLDKDDYLSCYVSNPQSTKMPEKVVVMIHGLGGSCSSGYLIRMARKIYQAGYCAIRVNLRNCGTGEGFSILPYNGGTSGDALSILKFFKARFPESAIILMGFSLGGNIALKLAGELGEKGSHFMNQLITVCPTIDLYHAVQHIEKRSNWIYHQYYLSHLLKQSKRWLKDLSIRSIYEFDDKITAPLWGYESARDYYNKSSASAFIQKITIPTKILFAADDPFIDYQLLNQLKLPDNIHVFLTEHGGHMGFLGWAGPEHRYYWMDKVLLEWIKE